MTETQQRAAVVREARRWTGTPYHHHAAVLGAGIDCAQLILEAFVGAGLAERFEVEHYTHDWHLHRGEERYLARIEERLHQVDKGQKPLKDRSADFRAEPGDVLVWRVGRTFSHGAIVTDWPMVVHASYPARSVVEESVEGGVMAEEPMRVYSLWGA